MSTYGPNLGPPKIRCLFCEMASVPHRHLADGSPPFLPCPSCWVGLCDQCDPSTYFCTCLDCYSTRGKP